MAHVAAVALDGAPLGSVLAVVPRPGLINKTGAPNDEHGFDWPLPAAAVAAINAPGRHRLDVTVLAPPAGPEEPLVNSPRCYASRRLVSCGAPR